jgi:hypothetical protein
MCRIAAIPMSPQPRAAMHPPQMEGTTMVSTVAEKAREAATVAIGLIEVLLVPTRLASAWERVAAAES